MKRTLRIVFVGILAVTQWFQPKTVEMMTPASLLRSQQAK